MQKQGVRGWRTFSLTEALVTYQTAKAAQAEALKDVALEVNAQDPSPKEGTALDTFVKGFDDAAAKAAKTNAQTAVTDAEADLAVAEAAVLSAAAAKLSDAGGSTDDAKVAGAGLAGINGDTRMTDANLASALNKANEAVTKAKSLYLKDGTDVADEDGAAQAGFNKIYTKDGAYTTDSTGAKQAGYSESLATIGAYDASTNPNGNQVVEAAGQASKASTVTFTIEDSFTGVLKIGGVEFSVKDGVFNTGDLSTVDFGSGNKGDQIATIVRDGTTGLVTITSVLADNEGVDISGIAIKIAPVVDTLTAKELQDAVEAAEDDLAADISANGDNLAMLLDLRADIIAYVDAGGDLTANAYNDGVAKTVADLLAVVNGIKAKVDADNTAGAEADADTFVGTTFKSAAFAANTSAAEKALNAAIKHVGERQDLETAVADAETAFFATDTGAVVEAAENLLAARKTLTDAVTEAETALETAQDNLTDLNAVLDIYDAKGEDVDTAAEALEALGVDNLVELATSNSGGTANEADLYLLTADTKDGIKLTKFEAADKLFIGDSFTRFDLEAADTLKTKAYGDAGTLEVFFQQDGNNVNLYFENESFDGNVTSGFAGTMITITGVQAANLELSDNGFITLA